MVALARAVAELLFGLRLKLITNASAASAAVNHERFFIALLLGYRKMGSANTAPGKEDAKQKSGICDCILYDTSIM